METGSSSNDNDINNVNITLIKGVTIALSCRAGKIPYKQICFLTSF